MKKRILLTLGTVAAITAPVLSVVSCGSDDPSVKSGHYRMHLGKFESSSTLLRMKNFVYPNDWENRISKIRHFTICGADYYNSEPEGIQYIEPNDDFWKMDLDVEFDYKLKLNDQNATNPFYVMDLSNMKLANEDNIIASLNNDEVMHIDEHEMKKADDKVQKDDDYLSIGGMFKDASISYSGKASENYPDEYTEAQTLFNELQTDNIGLIQKTIHDDMVEYFKNNIENKDITKLVISEFEKRITDFTPIKSREDTNKLGFELEDSTI